MSVILTHGANSLANVNPTPVLPEHCLLLDYFADGYSFIADNPTGTRPTAIVDVKDTDTYNLSYFDYSTRFPNGFPAALFDGTSSDTDYVCTALGSLDNHELTFEYLVRHIYGSTYSSNYRSTVTLHYPFGQFRCDDCNDTGMGAGINDSAGTYRWRGTYLIPTSGFIDGAYQWYGWHHVAVCIKNQQMQAFVDGKEVTNWSMQDPTGTPTLNYRPFEWDTNNWSAKVGCYQITQVAIWDYARWTSNFTVPTKLIIDGID